MDFQGKLKLLKDGDESFLPLLIDKYYKEIKEHYIYKMEKISDISEPTYGDFYRFSRLANAVTNDYNDEYNSVNTLLDDLLTDTCYDDYDKKAVMKELLRIVKDWKLNSRE